MPTTKATEAISQIEADHSKILGLRIGAHDVQLDQHIPVADAQEVPQLMPSAGSTTLSPTKTYLAISLDLDAPFPSFKVLSPILHWIQPGFRLGHDETGSAVLKTDAPFVSNYIPPSPPPYSGPHRYLFLLYEQPEGFDGTKYAPADGAEMGIWGRVRFDFDGWASEVGLGEALGGNWFWSN